MNTTDSLTSTPARAAHSLSAAVADGTISAEAAFCGLSPDDLAALAWSHPEDEVLISFRSAKADGRMTIAASYAMEMLADGTVPFLVNGVEFGLDDVRDVLSVAL